VKHIDVKHHWIHETVETGNIAVTYMPSEDNIADIFTKALPCPPFEKLVRMIGLSQN
jgi:methyl coenzyme M reductase subunit D